MAANNVFTSQKPVHIFIQTQNQKTPPLKLKMLARLSYVFMLRKFGCRGTMLDWKSANTLEHAFEANQLRLQHCIVYRFAVLIYEPVFCGYRHKRKARRGFFKNICWKQLTVAGGQAQRTSAQPINQFTIRADIIQFKTRHGFSESFCSVF